MHAESLGSPVLLLALRMPIFLAVVGSQDRTSETRDCCFAVHCDPQFWALPAETARLEAVRDPTPHLRRMSKRAQAEGSTLETSPLTIGCVSHIGGHKWAGNMIIYDPLCRLAGSLGEQKAKGIWYGRIDGSNVRKVLQSTLIGSGVVKDFCRRIVY